MDFEAEKIKVRRAVMPGNVFTFEALLVTHYDPATNYVRAICLDGEEIIISGENLERIYSASGQKNLFLMNG